MNEFILICSHVNTHVHILSFNSEFHFFLVSFAHFILVMLVITWLTA